ncbi:MAG: 2-amino-4-hydroxy-6-hydroxymethyldihydropteridine diphosphokinase [Polyangiales bacterium]
MSAIVVGVGTNLGAREAAIRAAQVLLDARDRIEVRAVSKIYETEPVGPPQPRYLNAALRLETDLSAREVLGVLLRTERRLDRRRTAGERWGPRSIDLDVLWDERGAVDLPDLHVPHRELRNRDFALAPFLDVAPEQSDEFRASLTALGGAPRSWDRGARTQPGSPGRGVDVEVEADSLVDACALCASALPAVGRAWSSRHVSIEAGPEQFAAALRSTLRSGFSIHCATLSHCSESQWDVQFHGVNAAFETEVDVRLQTTSGSDRAFRVHLSTFLTPR